MNEQRYIYEKLGELTQRRLIALCILTSCLFLFFMIFDYYIAPYYLLKYLPHRIVISIILAVLVFLSGRSRDFKYQQKLILIGGVAVTTTIEIISITFKQHHYFYYNGIHLAVIGTLGFLPIGARFSLLLLSIYYAIFFLPVLIFDPASLKNHSFIMLNAYLLSTCILAYTWRVSHQKTLLDWLRMQYKLQTDKIELQDFVKSQSAVIEKSEKILGHIISSASDGIIIMDLEGRVLRANPSAIEIYAQKKEDILGMTITSIGGEKSGQVWEKQLERLKRYGNVIFEIEYEDSLSDKRYFEVNVNRIKIGDEQIIQAFYRNITERRKIQQQMLLAQKMESVGVMACGISHDFKNVLSTVQSFVDYIRNIKPDNMACPHHQVIEEGVSIIEEETKKASEVVSQLLKLGEKGSIESLRFDLVKEIDHLCALFAKIMPSVKIIREHQSQTVYVHGNRGMIEQALSNIIINANEAMPEGGVLRILTEVITTETDMGESSQEQDNRKFIRVEISDTGMGIPEENLPHIFYPFYTMKTDNSKHGTGLGLTMAYDIIKDHGGTINVESIQGKGTKFSLYIPVKDERIEVREIKSMISVECDDGKKTY